MGQDMRVAIINDSHMGARSENPYVDEFFFQFWENVFFPYLDKHNIKMIFHLGDAFERRKFINFKILYNWRKKFFEPIAKRNINMIMLLGNHDIFHSDTSEVNAMEEVIARKYPNITILKDAQDITIVNSDPTIPVDTFGPFAMIPWINEENLHHTLDFLKTSQARIAFGHLEVSGFEMDRGQVCNEGFPRDLFNRFEKVYTGHFHHASNDGHIYYIGNQYQITWADYGDQRGFSVFDLNTHEIEFIPNPYTLFHKISYNDDFHDFEYWKKFDYSPYKNTYVKVIVIKKKNPYLFDTVLENIYRAKPIDVNVVEDFSDSPITTTGEAIDQAEDTMTILNKFVDINCNLEKPDKLKGLLREVYVEALDTEDD